MPFFNLSTWHPVVAQKRTSVEDSDSIWVHQDGDKNAVSSSQISFQSETRTTANQKSTTPFDYELIDKRMYVREKDRDAFINKCEQSSMYFMSGDHWMAACTKDTLLWNRRWIPFIQCCANVESHVRCTIETLELSDVRNELLKFVIEKTMDHVLSTPDQNMDASLRWSVFVVAMDEVIDFVIIHICTRGCIQQKLPPHWLTGKWMEIFLFIMQVVVVKLFGMLLRKLSCGKNAELSFTLESILTTIIQGLRYWGETLWGNSGGSVHGFCGKAVLGYIIRGFVQLLCSLL